MSSIHTLNLEAIEPQVIRNGGTRTMANEKNFRLLKEMALYSLRLYSGGVRDQYLLPAPYWLIPKIILECSLSHRFLQAIRTFKK